MRSNAYLFIQSKLKERLTLMQVTEEKKKPQMSEQTDRRTVQHEEDDERDAYS